MTAVVSDITNTDGKKEKKKVKGALTSLLFYYKKKLS